MAIIPPPEPISVKKEFADRYEPLKNFWERFETVKKEGSTIITYYGTSGVGKTSLLEKLKKDIKENPAQKEIVSIHLDFKDSASILSTLQKMQQDLESYGCNFPMFYTGEINYFLKTGNKTELYMAQNEFSNSQNKYLRIILNILSKAGVFAEFFMPGSSIVTCSIKLLGDQLIEHLEKEKILDDKHKKLKERLDDASADGKNPYEIYKLLPELFAQDVNDWLNSDKTEKNYLVVFLDTYEALTNEESATSGQLDAEAWLRNEGNPTGIIFLLANTLWVISGRNELHWEGSLADELEQYKLEPLNKFYADQFLSGAGVTSKELRDYIYILTKGLPYFLDLCVDVYAQYKRDHNGAEPEKSIFGKKRENVVKRLLQYMDDGTRDMIKFLCGLGRWTDEIAFEIGTKTFNFSQTTYDRVKDFSFIKREDFLNKNFETTIFSLDRTTQSFLLPSCDKNVIKKTLKEADQYFSKVLNEMEVDGEYIFNLEYWAKLTTRLAKSPDDLIKSYKKIFEKQLALLIKTLSWFDIAENILKIFLKEFTNEDGKFKAFKESVAFAYFEKDFGDIKKLQGLYKDSFKYHNSAYEKFSHFLGEKHEDTVDAMIGLATDLHYLGRYNDASTWNEQVLELTKKLFVDENAKTISAKQNYALTLDYLGSYDKALELQEEVLNWRKENLGDEHSETIDAMNDLALTLNNLGRYDKALALQKKVLALRKKILGDKHPYTINAMNNLALTLSYSRRYDKALEYQEKVLELRKKILGEEHPKTVDAINHLASTYINLGRYDEALKRQKQVVKLREKIFGAEHPKTVDAINHLASTYINLGRYDEALKRQEKVLMLRRKNPGAEHPKTIDAMKNLVDTYNILNRHEDALSLQQQIEQALKKNLGAEHPKTISAMNNLVTTLHNLGRYEEALELQKQIFSLQQQNIDAENSTATETINNTADVKKIAKV